MIRPVWRNARAAVVAGLMAVVWVVSAQEARAQATPGVEPSGPSTPVAEPASGTTQGPDAAGTLPGPESSTAGTAAPGGGASGARTEAVDLGSRPAALSFEFVPLVSQAGGGLTADGAAARVVQVSPTTRVAAAEAQVAERRAGRAYSVFMPRVDLTASYTRLSQATPRVPPELREPFLPVLDQYALRATMRVPVSDYFLTLHEQYDRAQRLAGVAELQRLGQWQAMAYQARSDYYELAGAIAGRNLARHRVDQLEKFVEEIRVLVEGGEVSRVQLEQARSRLSLARSEASAAVVRLRVAEQTLRSRLALPRDQAIGIAEPLTEMLPSPPPDLALLVQRGTSQRPEQRALVELLEAHRHAVDAADMARYPALALTGDATYARPNQRFIPPSERFDPSWSLGVELSWSPTDMATKADELDQAELEVTRVIEDMRELHGRITVEVTGAYENAVAARARVASAEEAVAAAEETHKVQLALFRGGEGTSRQVLDAELELRMAQLQWVDAVLATHLSHAAIDHSTGQQNY